MMRMKAMCWRERERKGFTAKQIQNQNIRVQGLKEAKRPTINVTGSYHISV